MRKIGYLLGIAGTLGMLHAPAQAAAITTLFSTGVDSAGNPLPDGSVDPHYTVSPGAAAFVIGNPGAVGWVGNTASSSWISATTDAQPGGGPFTYTTTFSLAGLNASTAILTGSIAADDQGSIILNGVVVFNTVPTGSAPWSFLAPFTITSGFVAGINTLQLDIPNNIDGPDDGPSGVQLDISGTASVPEPASMAMLGLGVMALGAIRRRRR